MHCLPPTGTWLRREGLTVVRVPSGPLEPLVEAALRDRTGLVVLGVFGSGKIGLRLAKDE